MLRHVILFTVIAHLTGKQIFKCQYLLIFVYCLQPKSKVCSIKICTTLMLKMIDIFFYRLYISLSVYYQKQSYYIIFHVSCYRYDLSIHCSFCLAVSSLFDVNHKLFLQKYTLWKLISDQVNLRILVSRRVSAQKQKLITNFLIAIYVSYIQFILGQ